MTRVLFLSSTGSFSFSTSRYSETPGIAEAPLSILLLEGPVGHSGGLEKASGQSWPTQVLFPGTFQRCWYSRLQESHTHLSSQPQCHGASGEKWVTAVFSTASFLILATRYQTASPVSGLHCCLPGGTLLSPKCTIQCLSARSPFPSLS